MDKPRNNFSLTPCKTFMVLLPNSSSLSPFSARLDLTAAAAAVAAVFAAQSSPVPPSSASPARSGGRATVPRGVPRNAVITVSRAEATSPPACGEEEELERNDDDRNELKMTNERLFERWWSLSIYDDKSLVPGLRYDRSQTSRQL